MAKLLYEDEWLRAMIEEDGFKLMYCLTREPRLLTLQHKGRNALHLAMRHNWYGLVQEILLQFKHLYDPWAESERKPESERRKDQDESSSSRWNLDSFREERREEENENSISSHPLLDLDALGEKSERREEEDKNFISSSHLLDLDALGKERERREEEDGNSSHLLDLHALRDLLTCKEGTSHADSSGLDVLAMALIQCHQGINILLASRISMLPQLFADHTYKDVVSCGGYGRRGKETDESDESERKLYYRKALGEVLEENFPNFSDYLKLDHAPNMCFYRLGRDWGETQSFPTRVLNLDPQTEPEICMWMLTNPFLPFSEHLILDYCCNWGKHETLLSSLGSDNLQAEIMWKEHDMNYRRYLLEISDTRRTVLHYAALNSSSALGRSDANPFLRAIIEDWPYYSQMRDSSRRTVGHLLLAVEPSPRKDGHPFYNFETFESLSNWSGYQRDGYNLDTMETQDPTLSAHWFYYGWYCTVNVEAVHRTNDYAYYEKSTPTEFRSLSLEQIIFTSPHITETGQRKWLQVIRDLAYPRNVYGIRPSVHAGVTSDLPLTPLQQYVMLGFNTLVKEVAQDDQYYDAARIKNQLVPEVVWTEGARYTSALQLAAERADPGILRIILGTGKFDTHYEDGQGNTLLHTAAFCEDATFIPFMLTDFLEVPDNSSGKLRGLEQSFKAKDHSEEERRHLESRRQGCVNLLLQEGLDIWETNDSGEIADPGPKASPDYSSWWYEKLTHETQDQKVSFSAAATAISVTAALVATASYVGPLQPPLGYSWEDVDQIAKVQAGVLPVRVFFVCNTLAFYLAVAAVVLSLTPTLPMPHESTSDELKRIRRSVTWALLLLIFALVAILSAFASASIVVIPNGAKWNHGWLTASGVVIGCIVCIAVLILCCTRAVKLVCHNNSAVDRFYRKWVCI